MGKEQKSTAKSAGDMQRAALPIPGRVYFEGVSPYLTKRALQSEIAKYGTVGQCKRTPVRLPASSWRGY